MTHDLSIELPFTGCVLITIEMVLLEKGDTVVSIRSSEVISTVRNYNFSYSVRVLLISIRNHKVTCRELLKLIGLRVKDSDVTIRSTDKEFLSIFSKLNARVELVFLFLTRLGFFARANLLFTSTDVGFREIIKVVFFVLIIPELEVTFSNSKGD